MILMLMLACGQEEAQCSEEQGCGFGEVCVAGMCTASTCVTSEQCGMEEHCSEGDCVAGCQMDSDCYPGDFCDLETSSCTKTPCYDSHTDCNFKEYCLQSTGECVEASGYYCRSCVVDSDCGGNGNVCMHWGLERNFCGVRCEVESDCPSGFICADWLDQDGNATRQCATYCWLYIDERPVPPEQQEGQKEASVSDILEEWGADECIVDLE
ncbi:MAG: hypothetical protein CMK59_02335 [Proteobacteria bacterium]|nr:hypothetical protein [Pseudomonadota bacterium]